MIIIAYELGFLDVLEELVLLFDLNVELLNLVLQVLYLLLRELRTTGLAAARQ